MATMLRIAVVRYIDLASKQHKTSYRRKPISSGVRNILVCWIGTGFPARPGITFTVFSGGDQ